MADFLTLLLDFFTWFIRLFYNPVILVPFGLLAVTGVFYIVSRLVHKA